MEKTETITITASYMDGLLNPALDIGATASRLKGKTGYKFARILKRLREEAVPYFEQKLSMQVEHGQTDEGGRLLSNNGMIIYKDPKEEHFQELSRKLTEIGSEIIDIGLPYMPIKDNDVENLTGLDWDILMPLFEDKIEGPVE